MKNSFTSEGNRSTIFITTWDLRSPERSQRKYDQWLRLGSNGILRRQLHSIDRDLKMVLGSTMYFKGKWIFEFTPTEPLMFRKPDEPAFPVSTIKCVFKKYHYGYLHDHNGEWLSIPYNSTEALLILLPNRTKNFQIDDFIAATPSSDIADIIDIINDPRLPNTLVNITMPRFKIKSSFDMRSSLKTVKDYS